MNLNEVSNTLKPDHEIEQFWLELKKNLIKFLDPIEQKEIVDLSNRLNQLQSKGDYKMIEKFIREHLEKIGYSMIIKGIFYHIHLLDTNFRRWKKISSEDIMKDDNIFYCLFKIYIMVNEDFRKNHTDGRIEITSLIKDYAKTKDEKILYDIASVAIKENYCGVLEKIRNIVDIRRFATDEGKEFFSKYNLDKMRANKFIKYIKSSYN